MTLNSKVNSVWNVKDICVQGEKSRKVENKAKSVFPVFLRSWKDLLEMLPWFSGLLCELVLVTGVVTLRANEFKGCNSESRGSLQHGPGLQMNIKTRGGVCTGQCKKPMTNVGWGKPADRRTPWYGVRRSGSTESRGSRYEPALGIPC